MIKQRVVRAPSLAPLLVLAGLVLSLSTVGQPRAAAAELTTAAMAKAYDSITSKELQRHIAVLANDSLEGREAGTRGGHAAGVYIRNEMVTQGLEPLGDDGDFFQYFQGRFRNIFGVIRGSDPELKNEAILIGAHYDHVGYGRASNSYGTTGYIHNGADDNASGIAALMELIEAFSRLPGAPRRSVVFACWDGEEKGLLGSYHYVRQPGFPLDRTRLFINMDMVGRLRNDNLIIHGARTGFGLRQLVATANRDVNLNLEFSWEIKENSDHYPFYQRQVPYVMLHTGMHDDYHRPRDDIEKINSAGLQQVVRLLFQLTYDAANQDAAPKFRPAVRYESLFTKAQLEKGLPNPAKRFGVGWNPEADAGQGVLVGTVRPGSPAADAGIRVGDRIFQFDGHEITRGAELLAATVRAESPALVAIRRDDSDQPQFLNVQLQGRPFRVGLSWQVDDAEPNSVFVNRVVAGSPANHADLRVGDRVYYVDGQAVASSEHFMKLLNTGRAPLSLQIERNGRLIDKRIVFSPLVPDDVSAEQVN